MGKEISELLKEVRDSISLYGVSNYSDKNAPERYQALNKAIELFKQLEDIGIYNISGIRSVGGTDKYENIEFPIIQESEEK